jgi:hypothetical protein
MWYSPCDTPNGAPTRASIIILHTHFVVCAIAHEAKGFRKQGVYFGGMRGEGGDAAPSEGQLLHRCVFLRTE